MKIIKPSAFMRAKPSDLSPLETECLYGEDIKILDEQKNWVYCKLVTDNYYGWVNKKNLGHLKKITHRVLNKRTFIYKEQSAKSNTLLYLPMGAKLAIEKIHLGWAETKFFEGSNLKTGFVPTNHIVEIKHRVNDWVAIAQQLEGVPYKWGGRDTLGIDCSALLQLSYQTYGKIIPRNTSDQIKLKKPQIQNIHDLKRGCVVFWKGHVGLMIDKKNCIHANAFHMKTVTEPLVQIISRMGDLNIIKIMDFN